MDTSRLVTILAGAAIGASTASACVMMPPTPPPMFWCEDHGDTDGDGLNNFWIGMEISLFASSTITNCACGIGTNGLASPLLEIDCVSVTVTDLATKVSEPIPEFDTLQRNDNTTAGLRQLDPDNTWVGFSGLVEPTYPTTPPPGSVFKIWFDVDAPDVGSLADVFATIAGGEAGPDGFPLVGGPHAIQLFNPTDNRLWVPSTGALPLLACAGLVATRRRR